jgi:hypothetical protein
MTAGSTAAVLAIHGNGSFTPSSEGSEGSELRTMTASGPRLLTLSLPAMAAFWRRYLSLFATEISAGKRFGEAGDRAGIFGDAQKALTHG